MADIITHRENENLITVNLGPTHPATHGVFQNIIKIDGEIIVEAVPTVGFIHRAFEKIAEHRPFNQITPLTDRLNYCSSPLNNIGWHLTVEKLLDIKTPKRVDYMRVIVMELARIADHIVCNSILGVDAGALSGFLYMFQHRENIYDIYEDICGARLTTNVGRIGGFEKDFTKSTFEKIEKFLKEFEKGLFEFEQLFNRNPIFRGRTVGVGAIDAATALDYGFTGPNLRATGIDYDVRAMNPYSSYQDFEFNVPVGTKGDSFDRFMVRNEEMHESMKIIRQAIKNMPEGPYFADAPEFYLPPKEEVYKSMEALIYHFKIIMGEMNIPVGEVYNSIEGGNGELGFYLISDGGRTPYRLHFRRPCFVYYQAFPEMIEGSTIADAVVTMSSINLIAGEMDA